MSIDSWRSTRSFGRADAPILRRAPVSSIASIALSGSCLAGRYLAVSSTAALSAAGENFTAWCSSYFGAMPLRISTVSATVGSSTCTDWNLRSSAASFSIDLWYSFNVVAPTHWSSPRASAGLRMFAASIAPSAPPAPTIVWISSRKRITFPERFVSSMSFLRRSSNCPRYCVPATMRAMSIATTRFDCIFSGTSPRCIACASPSTTAVLPTPASPMRTALFFVRRERIWTMRLSSLSRPMTGSSFPWRARSVRSRPNVLIVGVFCCFPFAPRLSSTSPSGASSGGSSAFSSAFPPPCVPAARNFSTLTPALKSSCAAAFSPSRIIAVTRWTVLMGFPGPPASMHAMSSTFFVRAVSGSCPRCITAPPLPAIIVRIDSVRSSTESPMRLRRWQAWHFGMARTERKMCSAPMWSCPSCLAQLDAALSASIAFFVKVMLTETSPRRAR